MRSSTPGRAGSRYIRDGRDALLVEPLPGPVVRRLAGGPVGDRAGRGHAEGDLVGAAGGVLEQVAGRLVGAGEPGADHHRRGAGGEGERDVARVPHSPVRPDVLPELGGRGRRTPGRPRTAAGRRRSSSGSCTSRPDPTPTLTMSAPASTRARVPSAETTLPATTGTDGRERADGAERLDHPVLVAVRGVDDQAVHAGVEQPAGLVGDVAVHADGGRDPQPARTRPRPGRRAWPAARRCGSARRPAARRRRPPTATAACAASSSLERLPRVACRRRPSPRRAASRPWPGRTGPPRRSPRRSRRRAAGRPRRPRRPVRPLRHQRQRLGDGLGRGQLDRRCRRPGAATSPRRPRRRPPGSGCPAGSPPARRGGPRSRPSACRRSRSCWRRRAGAWRRCRRRWPGRRRTGC